MVVLDAVATEASGRGGCYYFETSKDIVGYCDRWVLLPIMWKAASKSTSGSKSRRKMEVIAVLFISRSYLRSFVNRLTEAFVYCRFFPMSS